MTPKTNARVMTAPTAMPPIARPRPWVPSRLIPFSARMPRTRPTGAVIGSRNDTRLVTRDAIASPLVRCAAYVLPGPYA